MRFSYHYSQSTGTGLGVQPSTAAATAAATAKTAESFQNLPQAAGHHQAQQLLWVTRAVPSCTSPCLQPGLCLHHHTAAPAGLWCPPSMKGRTFGTVRLHPCMDCPLQESDSVILLSPLQHR